MANRKFEMYEYRQVLMRMRLGETDRALAKTGLMGRRKLGEVRRVAEAAGWLDPARPLPDDATLAERLQQPAVRSSSISLVEPFAEDLTRWWREGIAATTIAAALKLQARVHGQLLLGAALRPASRRGLSRICQATPSLAQLAKAW